MSSAGEFEGSWARCRVVVTGGAGFIGSALVYGLNQRGCSSVSIVDFVPSEAKRRNLAPLRFDEYIEPQTLLARAAQGYLRSFDFIFHLGACSSTTETDAAYLLENNYEYTKRLSAASLEAGVRFVYASSAATYGDGCAGMDDSSYEGLERLRPLNLYGESKHLFDLEAWRKGWLEHTVGLKFFNIFGPNEDHKGDMRSVVNKSYEQATADGVIRLFRSYRPEIQDGEQKRDFLYVQDAVEMTLYLAANHSATGLFNIGSGQAHSWNELARAVFLSLQIPARIEYIDMPEHIRSHYQYFTRANIGKLRNTGYSQQVTSLHDAVYDYIRHYLMRGAVLGQEGGRRTIGLNSYEK